jgi:starch phosphorylase
MKAAMNGGLNLSILDGWWPEGCEHGVTGWAVGDGGQEPDRDPDDQDARDQRALLDVLEAEVLPAWADPARWLRMMRAAVAMGTGRFSAERMVRDYFAHLYAEDAGPDGSPPPPDAAATAGAGAGRKGDAG